MKAWKLVLTVIFALASVAAAAKTLEITVTDIRSDKGNVLAMAKVAGLPLRVPLLPVHELFLSFC